MLTLVLVATLSQTRPIKAQDQGVQLGNGWVHTVNCGDNTTCTRNAATGVVTISATAGGGGGLPDGGDISGAAYVTFQSETALSAERVLSAGNYTTVDLGTTGQAQVDWAHGLTCTSGQALTSSGTTALACTSTLTASDVACAGTCVGDAEIAAVSGAKVSGTVASASAAESATYLDLTCSAGQYVTCSGLACSCSTPAGTYTLPDSTSSVTGGVRLTGDLGGTATSPSVVDDSHAHTGTTISALDTGDITTGTLPAARGGLGAAQPTCAAGDFLTCNGTSCSCSTPAGGGGGLTAAQVSRLVSIGGP